MSIVQILPYLRKGLAREISDQSEGLRASFEVKAKLVGTVAGSEEDAKEVSIKTEKQLFQLVGPVDVRMVEPAAISEIVPADKSEGYSNGFMPFIEFYEEDFPWRYTPMKASEGKLKPWLLLLACKDDEFTVTSDNKGYRRVTVEPKGEGFYPKVEDFHKLAHVQVTMPDGSKRNPAEYVNENPDDGISRLFCNRQLEAKTHYTMFLVPAFELGRRAGMGESLEGAGLQQLAWNDESTKLSFPVYYQWSFKTGAEAFLELAKKQWFITDSEFQALPDGLKLDIQETGLREYRGFKETINEDKVLVDMPAALVKRGFDESKLSEEVPKFKVQYRNGISPTHMTDELKKLQLMSPVFSENAQLTETDDPWVVPPVYGARHILAKQDDLDNEKLFLNKLNLRFRNRAAAGLGVSVVKRNQEVFTNRAWGMVEEINALNQRIREYYEAVKANGAASAKATSLRYYHFSPHAAGLQADAAIRVANAQSATNVNAVDVAMDIALGKLAVRSSVLQPFQKAVGVTKQELEVISDVRYWQGRWADIVRISPGYSCLTGDTPFYSQSDRAFRFLYGIFDVDYANVKLDNDRKVATPEKSSRDGFFNFTCKGEPAQLPELVKNYLAVKDIGWYKAIFISEKQNVQQDLNQLLTHSKYAKQEYDSKWGDNLGTYYSQLYTRCLPPKGYVYDDRHNLVGYAVYMKHGTKTAISDESEFLMDNYPNGVRLVYKDTQDKKKKSLYILPAERFKDAKEFRMIFGNSDGNDVGFSLVRNEATEGFFKPSGLLNDTYAVPYIFERNICCSLAKENWQIDFGNNQKSWAVHKNPICIGRIFVVLQVASQLELSGDCPLPPSGTPRPVYQAKADKGGVSEVWASSYLCSRVMIQIKYRESKKGYPVYSFLVDKETWVDEEKTKRLCYTVPETGITYLRASYLREILQRVVAFGEWADSAIWQPNQVILTEESLKKVPVVTADTIGNVESAINSMKEYYDLVCAQAEIFHGELEQYNLVSSREEPSEPDAQIIGEEDLIDADEENRKRLLELTEKFAERGMTLDLSISNFDGKYPIMAYPIFPDPTSFYLRELSERFILPSVDQLKKNSISCFVTNPIFEEAFLAGMNTEMGRELLWREYPTDERGSYFRKFWDQVELPNDFSKGYFDVKFLHNWKKRLGANHEDGKGQLVVFIIKSELMMQYPQTGITLSRPTNGVLDPVLAPTMTGWLSNDTYMAGFDISKLSSTKDLYLTFTETDKSQRFSWKPISENNPDKSTDLSSDFAVKHKNDGTVWGCGIKPEYLVVNQLNLEDDESEDSGSGFDIRPKPDFRLDQQNPDLRDVRPELKR